LIDTDLRKPALHTLFNLRNDRGLTNILAGSFEKSRDIQPSGISNLYLITAGSAVENPLELLSSKRMETLLRAAKAGYDYVILDSPPVTTVADALTLSSLTEVDGVMLVVRAENTSQTACLKAKSLLETVNANVLGVILNDIKPNGKHMNLYNYAYTP